MGLCLKQPDTTSVTHHVSSRQVSACQNSVRTGVRNDRTMCLSAYGIQIGIVETCRQSTLNILQFHLLKLRITKSITSPMDQKKTHCTTKVNLSKIRKFSHLTEFEIPPENFMQTPLKCNELESEEGGNPGYLTNNCYGTHAKRLIIKVVLMNLWSKVFIKVKR